MTEQRGQLVVLAALALAIALVPMAVAYLQLGYDDDVRTATVEDDTTRDVEQTLYRALVDASGDVPVRYSWRDRDGATTAVRDRLQPTIASLTTSSVDSDTAITVSYNGPRASAWAANNCPSGPAREFGQCVSDRGVVVQERDGQTHILAVAVDVTVTTTVSERSTTTVVTLRP